MIQKIINYISRKKYNLIDLVGVCFVIYLAFMGASTITIIMSFIIVGALSCVFEDLNNEDNQD